MKIRHWSVVVAMWFTVTTAVSVEPESKAMINDLRTKEAIDIMLRFTAQTGVTSNRPQRRYLWTDAFAVVNFIGLAQRTNEERFIQLAFRLVDKVHYTLVPRFTLFCGFSKTTSGQMLGARAQD